MFLIIFSIHMRDQAVYYHSEQLDYPLLPVYWDGNRYWAVKSCPKLFSCFEYCPICGIAKVNVFDHRRLCSQKNNYKYTLWKNAQLLNNTLCLSTILYE